MSEESPHTDHITLERIIIIIPTYNNANTLVRILEGVLSYNLPILLVNDGSTDHTAEILSAYTGITVIHFPNNQGKGMALRAGFKQAKEEGYTYAITIDSDGQHYPSDIALFLAEIKALTAPTLLIGSRNMTQSSVPKKSSFGNRFSNFWFWVETGIKLSDTQSGFRAYPLQGISNRFFTRKFEFEIEVIVRAAWRGTAVRNIPIRVLYDPAERVSHFRPFQDFSRISVLNTLLVILTFSYIIPRNFLRSFKKKSLTDFFKENVLGSEDSAEKKAASIGLGVFMGIAPVWGFQTALVITLSVFFRLNKILAFAFSNISFPPFIPIIIYASLLTGGMLMPTDLAHSLFSLENISFDTIQKHIYQYIVGSLMLALIMGLLAGFGSYLLFKLKLNKVISAE